MLGDDSRDDYNEGPGRPADLCLRAAQGRDQKTRDDGAIQSRLGWHSGRDGKRHRQRQRDKANGHTGDQVGEKFVAIITTQQEYRFREPGFEGGCHAAFNPGKKSVKILARSQRKWPCGDVQCALKRILG